MFNHTDVCGIFSNHCRDGDLVMIDPDLAIRIAGVLAMLAAMGHGYLGDKALAKVKIEPDNQKSFTRWCYQFGSFSWLVGGIVFLIAPDLLSGSERNILIVTFAPIYLFGALVNLWFTKARHPGWVMLLTVVVLSIFGRV